jgi:hypothetical protein
MRHGHRMPQDPEHNDFQPPTRHRRPGRRQRASLRRVYGIVAGVTVLVLAAVAGVLYSGHSPAEHIALSAADCPQTTAPPAPTPTPTPSTPTPTPTTSTLPTGTSTTTLLGVNATSPSQLTTRTAQFGHLPILRVYYTGMPDPNLWTGGVQGLNHSGVVVSFRSLPATVLSGADDAALAKFFDSAPSGYPIYWSYYHEPETLVQAGTFTTAQYRAAWAHIAAIAAAAHNPELKATLILMTWDLDPASGINWKAGFMGKAETASRSVGLPFGFAEFALGTETDRPQWLSEVASYLQSTGALFGTLFDSTGFPWMELTDTPSIQSWQSVIGSDSAALAAATSTAATPAASATAASAAKASAAAVSPPSASASANPQGPSLSQARIDPAAFVPTGQNHVRILFKLSQMANIAVCVLNSQGVALRELDHANQPAGWESYWYYGYNTTGALLPAGTYTIVIAASNSSGSTTTQTPLTIGSGSSA